MAITFAGGQYFYVINDALFNTLTTQISYMVWVNLTRLPTSADGSAFAFFGRSNNASGRYSWECGVLPNGNPVSEITTNTGLVDATSSFVMAANTWYHYATTWDSTSQNCLIYINGVLTATISVPGTSLATPTNSAPLCVGANLAVGGGANQELVGAIDGFRIYNRLLSAAEISTIYACHSRDDIVNGLFSNFRLIEEPIGAGVTLSNVLDYGPNKIAFTTLVGSPTYTPAHNSVANKPFRTI